MGAPRAKRVCHSTPKQEKQRRKPGHLHGNEDAIVARVRELRHRLHSELLSRRELRELMHHEEQRNIWAARVQLRSVARDLIPDAARLARKGRSRLLQVVGNILIGSESLEQKTQVNTTDIVIEHHVQRPDRTVSMMEVDPKLRIETEQEQIDRLAKRVGEVGDTVKVKH